MDINMRGTNGIEATAQFKQAFPRIAVLILSMHDKVEYVSQADPGRRARLRAQGCARQGYRGGHRDGDVGRHLLQRRAGAPAGAAARPGQPADHARARGAAPHRGGRVDKQIARALDLSVRTVETHRLNIKRKLGIEGQAELIRFAVQHALVAIPERRVQSSCIFKTCMAG
jgi:hypothetical protein